MVFICLCEMYVGGSEIGKVVPEYGGIGDEEEQVLEVQNESFDVLGGWVLLHDSG